jgi:Tfp pilus assembly protein PilP
MKSKTIAGFLAGGAVLALLAGPLGAQQASPGKKEEPAAFSYSSGGRRDPFKDLLGGQEVREKRVITGFADLLLDEIKIMGIVATKADRVAIVALPEGFPVSVHEGDRFAEGYILSIGDGQVVLRKTRDRGIPLQKPRDIVKEITPEERQDE